MSQDELYDRRASIAVGGENAEAEAAQKYIRKRPKRHLWHRKDVQKNTFGTERTQEERVKANKTEFPDHGPPSTCQKGYPKGLKKAAPDASRRSKSLKTCHREASWNRATKKS